MGNRFGFPGFRARLFTLTVLCALLAFVTPPLRAQATTRFDLPAQPLADSLRAVANQTNTNILIEPTLVSGLTAPPINEQLSLEEALSRLLAGTGLKHQFLNDHTVVLSTTDVSTAPTSGAQGEHADADKKSLWDRRRLAQASGGQGQSNPGAQGSTDQTVQQPQGSESPSGKSRKDVVHDKDGNPIQLEEIHMPEVLIRGSNVMNVDVKRTEDDAQPYYILDSKQIEQSGATNIEDFLNQRLTMDTSFRTNSQGFGSADVTSSINLRGLGANETLILIDGRRSANVTSLGTPAQPDINGIPLSAIERIEVLPGSASAIYGGAAVGGVVNIILKKNFNGGDVGYTYENTTNANSPRRTVNATYGFSLEEGKTNVMVSGHYSDGEPLRLQDRLNLVQRGISNILRNNPSFLYSPSNPFPGATPNIASADGSNLVLKNGTPLNSPITYVPAGAAPGTDLSAGLLANAGTYNLNLANGTGEYGLQNEFGSVPRTKSLMATIRREFTDAVEAFTEFSTISNAGRQPVNPFGNYTIPASAPTNPFQQAVTLNIPNVTSVPIASDSVTQSITVGAIVHLPDEWRSEFDYTWSRNAVEFSGLRDDRTALDSALADGTINPFADTIAHPLSLASYLGTTSSSTQSTMNDLGLRASGPVGSLPWGRPTLTVGLEHRKEGFHDGNYSFIFPSTPANDQQTIFFGQSQSTDSLYAEAQIPLVTQKNALPGIRSLDLQLAGRSEHYTVFTGTYSVSIPPQPYDPPQGVHTTVSYTSSNPTLGLKYKLVDDVIFRVSYATAFLPPTATQLLPNLIPRCGFPCVPITDPRNGQTYNVDTTGGGNPKLKPQTSRDWGLGLIWEPKEALQGLRTDVEYYKITQPNYIVFLSQQQAANFGYVTRDPVSGLITIVNPTYVNATLYKTSGWDLTLDYRKPTALGTFDLHALGTLVEHDQRQYDIASPLLEYVGYANLDDLGEAKVKANVTLTWEYRRWALGWTTHYVGRYLQTGTPGSPIYIQFGTAGDIAAAQGSDTIPSQIYQELFGSYSFGPTRQPLSGVTIQFGVKNLLNKLPPFDADHAPYFYSTYGDPRLRTYWLSVKKSFGG